MRNKIPSDKQIATEIKRLKEIYDDPKFPKRSFFGDDNVAKIEAQVTVLEDRMDEDAVNENSIFDDDPETEGREWEPSVREAAMDAVNWLTGEEKEKPSLGWEPLVQEDK